MSDILVDVVVRLGTRTLNARHTVPRDRADQVLLSSLVAETLHRYLDHPTLGHVAKSLLERIHQGSVAIRHGGKAVPMTATLASLLPFGEAFGPISLEVDAAVWTEDEDDLELSLDAADSGVALGAPSASTRVDGEPAPEGEAGDIFGDDFDMPAMDEESGAEVVALDEPAMDMDEECGEAVAGAAAPAMPLEEEEEEEAPAPALPRAKATRAAPARAAATAAPDRAAGKASRPANVWRHATVRYYSRMSPGRLYRLLVTLTQAEVKRIVQKRVAQESKRVPLKEGSEVVIEPVLPGCSCYPPTRRVTIGKEDIEARFQVVPHILGDVSTAHILLHREGAAPVELPLKMRVSNPAVVALMGLASLCLPFASALMRHFRVDFESQLEDRFSLYTSASYWLINRLTPEVMAGALVALTILVWLWIRPRERDAFWDITPDGLAPEGGGLSVADRMRAAGASMFRLGLIGAAVLLLVGGGVVAAIGALASWERAAMLALPIMGGMAALGAAGGAVSGLIDGVMAGGD